MCVRLSFRDEDGWLQKRHEAGDRRAREAASFSSIDFIIMPSSSDVPSGMTTEADSVDIFAPAGRARCEFSFSGLRVGSVDTLISFSLCLLDWR